MKVWIGKDEAQRYRMLHPERAKEWAIYAFWQGRKFRRKPELVILKDRAPDYGLHGTPCGLFFAWRDLIVYFTNVDSIARLCRWDFNHNHNLYVGNHRLAHSRLITARTGREP